MVFAVQVTAKGAADRHAVHAAKLWLAESGLTGTIRIRTDSENPVRKFAELLAATREAVTIVDDTPVASHSSLGMAENVIQRLEGQVRTLLLAFKTKFDITLTADSPMFGWMVSHAAWLISRFQPYHGSKTPFQQLHSIPFKGQVLEFGTVVWQ